jgi:glycosyltransferase involved in cell wall biosynthesis
MGTIVHPDIEISVDAPYPDGESGDGDTGKGSFTILIPVYDDWRALNLLLRDVDRVVGEHGLDVDVLIVDDGSPTPMPHAFQRLSWNHIRKLEVLELVRNLGHQRAICVGLVMLSLAKTSRNVIVMDGDGEDGPDDIIRLIERFRQLRGAQIVFAQRTRRAEGLLFKLFYLCFKLLHILLVGDKVRVGNFSLIPYGTLNRLVFVSELWNHYAAAVIHSRFRFAMTPIDRRRRLFGKSKMNFISLVLHGLTAISVYADRVGIRLLIITLIVWLVCAGGVVARTTVSAGSPSDSLPISAVLLLVTLFQTVVILVMTVFVVLLSRSHTHLVPLRDCPLYVMAQHTVFVSRAAVSAKY